MPVEEQIFETAAASNGALEKGVAGKEHDAANGHGDAGGEEFEELGDLETVDVTGGALLQHLPETHVHAQGGDDEAQDPLAMNPDLLPDSSHLSASATPDKAREIEAISERIIILHEHLQKSNMNDTSEEMAGRIKQCRSVEEVSFVLKCVVKEGFDCHPTFSLWSHQDRADWEKRCSDSSSVEAMSDLVADLERQVGVSTCERDDSVGAGLGGHEVVKTDYEAEALPEEAAVEEQAPATTSRYGRARAVPNFARMVDPLAQRAQDVPAPRAPPSNGGADDVQATATQHMIELVRVIVSKAPKPEALSSPAAGAPGQPASGGQDKYVGVRIKQNGYGAVIKKNHSEINLGTFQTPEEAARAYDMAALMCQGDRAKVNFLDSWDIVQQYDTTAIREPFRDHHRETREHTAAMHSARQHSLGQGGVDFTPLTYDSADTSKPISLGRLLNSFADRFPYAAVRDLDPAVWDVFTERNSTLSSFGEFGSQLLWLSSQVTDAAMRDSWGLHQGVFERDCRTTDEGEKCVQTLKLYDQQGVDWDKVQSLWEIDDGEGGESMSKRGHMKRKRAGDVEGREKIEDFLHFNWHILSEFERDGTQGMPAGIEPTLNLMRSHRQVPKPAVEERPKKLPQPVHVPKPEVAVRRPVLSTSAAKPANPKPVLDRRAGREREREKEEGSSSKNKGMQCRFCGKVFTHAPAHLQHERAHLQQQETKNPSSRIFQHVGGPLVTSGNSIARTLPGAQELGSGDDIASLQSGSPSQQLSRAVKMEHDDCLVDPAIYRLDELEPHVPNPDDEEDEDQGEREDEDKGADGDMDDEEVDDEEEPARKRTKGELEAGAPLTDPSTCTSRSCVDQGVPCPPCAKQNKGIAACFAQGHLYLTQKGEMPSSCKDCKARNKGALFCFKRGHMVNLRAMLGGSANETCSRAVDVDADDVDAPSAVDPAGDEDGGGENDFDDADGAEVEGDEDVSGPVSPSEGDISL